MKRQTIYVIIIGMFFTMVGSFGCSVPSRQRKEHPVVQELQDIEFELRRIRKELEEIKRD